jgi:hypothetical protein
VHKRWRTSLKVGGWSIGGILTLLGVYCGLLIFPGLLFSHEVEYKNLVAYADSSLRGDIEPILAEVETRLLTSSIYDPAEKHEIFFGHGNKVFGALQHSRSKLVSLAIGRPITSLSYNVSWPPHFSHIVTFLVPDFERNMLIHPQARDGNNMTYVLTHEVAHSLVNARLGLQRATRLPLWKYEGYPEYIAASHTRRATNYSFRVAVERLMREDLSWMKNGQGAFVPFGYDCMSKATIQIEQGYWPTCYYVSRLMVEYLLDVKGLSFEELMSSSVSDVGTFVELVADMTTQRESEEDPTLLSPNKSLQRAVDP